MEQVQSEPRQMKRRKTLEDLPSETSDGSASETRGEAVLEAKHKVFLSHSGAQKNFVEQVCVDLERCDRYPFFDKRRHSLGIGQNFPEVIFEAIRQCQVGVLIMSEEFFTRTKWPMLELAAMVESKKQNSELLIMPVFLGISREQCRNVENHKRWERVWLTWKQTDPRIDVEKWMEALSIFGPTNGLMYKEVLGEVKFREEIVEAICGGVPAESRWDDSHVQGRSRLCQVKRTQVNKSFGVRVIGVYGVGGLGKTTISKTLCNDYSKEFRDKVVHVEFGNHCKVELMRGVLRKLTNTRPEVLEGYDEGEVCYMIAKFLLFTIFVYNSWYSCIDEGYPIIALGGLSDALSLEKIYIQECAFNIIPHLGNLKNLRMLDIYRCPVQALPGLGELVGLEFLCIVECSMLNEIPDLHKLSNLRELLLWQCALKTVRGLEGLKALKRLCVHHCGKLVSLPELGMLKKLQQLVILGCSSLESLPSMKSVNNLKTFSVDERLVLLERHKLPAGVDNLVIYRLGSAEVPNSASSESRGNCWDLIDLNSLPTLPNVYSLELTRCNFGAVAGVINCIALRELHMFRCHDVEGLPDLPYLEKLRIRWSKTKEVISMGFFPKLEHLEFYDLAITKLPDFSICFPNLVSLRVSNCDELASLESSGLLTALKVLHVSSCVRLRGLPDLRLSTKLISLHVWGCGIRLTKPHSWNCKKSSQPMLSSWPNVEWEVLP